MEPKWDEELNPEVEVLTYYDPASPTNTDVSDDEDLPPIPLRPRRTTVQDI